MEIIEKIVTSILTTLYTYFGFSLLLGFSFIFVYEYIEENGYKSILKLLKQEKYIKFFLFSTFTTMVLFRTLLNRDIWSNPLSDVFGGWTIEKSDGAINTEPIENIILFIPFSFLLGYVFHKDFKTCVLYSVFLTFFIEFSQLFFRLGTFQISDLVYNTIGGIIGACIYVCMRKIFKH